MIRHILVSSFEENSDIPYSKPVFQPIIKRFLVISCCSHFLQTVKFLFKYILNVYFSIHQNLNFLVFSLKLSQERLDLFKIFSPKSSHQNLFIMSIHEIEEVQEVEAALALYDSDVDADWMSAKNNQFADLSGTSTSTSNEIKEDPEPELISMDQYHHGQELQERQQYFAFEELQDQLTQLDNYNWAVMNQCKEAETRRRIAKRSIPRRIKDRLIHWKYQLKRAKAKASNWIKKKRNPELSEFHNYLPPYTSHRGFLMDRYFAADMEFPDIEDPELF